MSHGQHLKKLPNILAIFASLIAIVVINSFLKRFFQELRPCISLPYDFILAHCPRLTNYAFPSGHAIFAAGFAMSLYYVNKHIGVIAAVLAVLIGLSRIYVGAHYPHDVFVGLCLGALIAASIGRWLPIALTYIKPPLFKR